MTCWSYCSGPGPLTRLDKCPFSGRILAIVSSRIVAVNSCLVGYSQLVEVGHKREAVETRSAGSSAGGLVVNLVTRNMKGFAESEVVCLKASRATAYCFVALQIPASQPASSIRRTDLNSIKRHRLLTAPLLEG